MKVIWGKPRDGGGVCQEIGWFLKKQNPGRSGVLPGGN